MRNTKLEKIVDIRVFLINNDVTFKENINGHFQVFNDNATRILDIWATTEKAIDTDNKYVIGADAIKNFVIDNVVLERRVEEIPTNVSTIAGNVMRAQLNAALEDIKAGGTIRILSAAVELPTGAVELITNNNNIESKVNYYLTAYDEALRLKNNPDVRIVGILIV